MRTPADVTLHASRSRWLAARARNLVHRSGTLVTVGGVTFLLVFGLLLWFTRAERAALLRIPAPADTTALARRVARAARAQREADSVFALVPVPVRHTVARAVTALADSLLVSTPTATDTAAGGATSLTPAADAPVAALPDSLRAAVTALSARLQRAQNAPLAASWRALAADPLLQQDPRVRALADSLVDAERARNEYDAVGGVDPIYLELSSRVTGVGRAIERAAQQRLTMLLQSRDPVPQVAVLPLGPSREELARRYAADSTRYAAARAVRDAAAASADSVAGILAAQRREALRRDSTRARALSRVEALAPPTAMVSASLAAAVGLALLVTLVVEVRAPRLADEREVASQARVPVLLTIGAADASTHDALTSAFSQLVFDLGMAWQNTRTLLVVGDDAALATRTGARIAERLGHEGRRVRVVAASPGADGGSARTTPRAPRGRPTPVQARSVLVEPERGLGVSWTGEFAREQLTDDMITVRAGNLEELRAALVAGEEGARVILVVRTGSTATAWLEKARGEIHRARTASALGVVIWAPDIDEVDPVTFAFDGARAVVRPRVAAAAS